MQRTLSILVSLLLSSCFNKDTDLSGIWVSENKYELVLTRISGERYSMTTGASPVSDSTFKNPCEEVDIDEQGGFWCHYNLSKLNILHYDKSADVITGEFFNTQGPTLIFRRK